MAVFAYRNHDTKTSARVVIYQYRDRENGGTYVWNCPVFAAYADKTVLWRKAWAPSVDAFAKTNSQMAEETVRKVETMVAQYAGRTFILTGSSDPDCYTTLWSSGMVMGIVGDWRKPHRFHRYNNDPKSAADEELINEYEKKRWSALPSDIRDMLVTIEAFDDVDGKSWRPEKLELWLQTPNHPRGDALVWPAQWPQTFTKGPKNSGGESIELPGSMLEEVLHLFPADGESAIVVLRGESRYLRARFIFPAGTDRTRSELDKLMGMIFR